MHGRGTPRREIPQAAEPFLDLSCSYTGVHFHSLGSIFTFPPFLIELFLSYEIASGANLFLAVELSYLLSFPLSFSLWNILEMHWAILTGQLFLPLRLSDNWGGFKMAACVCVCVSVCLSLYLW